MEELRKLEQVQKTLSLIQCNGLVSSTSEKDSVRFIANLVILLVQPCGELDMATKRCLVSEYIPKISDVFLNEASECLSQEDGPQEENQGYQEIFVESRVSQKLDIELLQLNNEDVTMVGLDAVQRANSTLEDFCRSYFMFHGLDIEKPQSIFKYLPVLSFVESYIYQLDGMNEKIAHAKACSFGDSEKEKKRVKDWNTGLISKVMAVFETNPFGSLTCLLESHGLLTERIRQELRSGKEYWMLERKLCFALAIGEAISVEDVMRAIHLKSFDYRVLNLLLYQLRGDEVNDLHMEFLSISEFLVEVSDDLFDYEEDVLENNFNILRMFVRIFGSSMAPAMLAKYITEAEEKYEHLLKALDPDLSLNYRRRCEEATKEGGKVSGHSLGTWNIPPVIGDEEFYRSSLLHD